MFQLTSSIKTTYTCTRFNFLCKTLELLQIIFPIAPSIVYENFCLFNSLFYFALPLATCENKNAMVYKNTNLMTGNTIKYLKKINEIANLENERERVYSSCNISRL